MPGPCKDSTLVMYRARGQRLGMLILLPLDLAGQGWAWGPVTQGGWWDRESWVMKTSFISGWLWAEASLTHFLGCCASSNRAEASQQKVLQSPKKSFEIQRIRPESLKFKCILSQEFPGIRNKDQKKKWDWGEKGVSIDGDSLWC